MKNVHFEIKTIVEAMIGQKTIDELLREVASICHEGLEETTSKTEFYESLYEKGKTDELYKELTDVVSTLEGKLCRILDLLGD